MPDYFKKFGSQSFQVFNALSAKNKMLVITAVLVTVGSLIGLIAWSNRIDYKPVYIGLSSEDAGVVVSWLRDKKIPFKVGAGGGAIMVPSSKVYELRMEMASEGLPQSGGIGYEIFDRQNLGVTEFVQNINFQRALQGELTRTINQFSAIKKSRVHLTLPKKTLFLDEQKQPRASVVLTLYPGRFLNKNQIQGIMRLVANSVEGMSSENVIIIDSSGKLLGGGKEQFKDGELSTSRQHLKAKIESNIENKIESMLAEVVGADKITARVSVAMDFTSVEQTEETYDPDSAAVRSEQSTTETSSGKRPVASGVPGVMSNTPDAQQAASAAAAVKSTSYNKKDETINYEISRVTKRVVNSVGTVERLTAAVLIDGTYTTGEGNEAHKYVPRSEEEMKKFLVLVKRAVGFDEDRGDSIEVVNVQFHEVVPEEETVAEKLARQVDVKSMMTYIITAILFALFFVFGLRPLIRSLTRTIEVGVEAKRLAPSERKEIGEGAEEYAADIHLPGAAEKTARQSQLISFAQKNPRAFAQYLKGWMEEG